MILTREKLEMLYAYYESLKNGDGPDYSDKTKLATMYSSNKYYALFAAAINIMEMNKFPVKKTQKRYVKMKNPKLYRGAIDLEFHASMLFDYDYHKGAGVDFQGIYATPLENFATQYCVLFESRDGAKNVKIRSREPISFKLEDDSRVITVSELYELYSQVYNKPGRFEKRPAPHHSKIYETVYDDEQTRQNLKLLKKFMKTHPTDTMIKFSEKEYPTIFATLLGFDAIEDDSTLSARKRLIVLNRNKMVFSGKEYNKIAQTSKIYHGGVINFDLKQDEDFLRE